MRKIVKTSGITILVVSLIGCSSSVQFVSRSESENKTAAEQGQNNQVASSPSPPSQLADYALKKSVNPLPNDMYFKDYGTNQFVSAAKDRLSTFAADVDTASYTIMRNFIKDGNLPPAEAIRVEEFINFFPTSYPAPTDQTFAIQADSGPSPFQKNLQVVRIGIKGKELRAEERKPANLVFVIDVSGSMNRENRLELVKKSLHRRFYQPSMICNPKALPMRKKDWCSVMKWRPVPSSLMPLTG